MAFVEVAIDLTVLHVFMHHLIDLYEIWDVFVVGYRVVLMG